MLNCKQNKKQANLKETIFHMVLIVDSNQKKNKLSTGIYHQYV
jgi:hypothetical protein